MFRLLTEPSSRVFMSLKLHTFTNVCALVHFVSTVLTPSLLLMCTVTLYLCWTDRLVISYKLLYGCIVLYHLIPWGVFLWCVLYLVVCESYTIVPYLHHTTNLWPQCSSQSERRLSHGHHFVILHSIKLHFFQISITTQNSVILKGIFCL